MNNLVPTIEQIISGAERPPNIPAGWVGSPVEQGQSWRWSDPENTGNSVTFYLGDPASPDPSKRVPYVVVHSNGHLIGRDGRPVGG